MTGGLVNAEYSYDWNIYIDPSVIEFFDSIRTIENQLLDISDYKDDLYGTTYDIRRNLSTGKLSVLKYPHEDCLDSISIGGFIILDCEVKYLFPFDGCDYKRIFSDEFTFEYNKDNTNNCT